MFSYEVWIDQDDLMRKVSADLGGTSVTMLLDSWGQDVLVSAPDPAQVRQARALRAT